MPLSLKNSGLFHFPAEAFSRRGGCNRLLLCFFASGAGNGGIVFLEVQSADPEIPPCNPARSDIFYNDTDRIDAEARLR